MNYKVIKFERKQIMDFVFDKMWIQQHVRVNFFVAQLQYKKLNWFPLSAYTLRCVMLPCCRVSLQSGLKTTASLFCKVAIELTGKA